MGHGDARGQEPHQPHADRQPGQAHHGRRSPQAPVDMRNFIFLSFSFFLSFLFVVFPICGRQIGRGSRLVVTERVVAVFFSFRLFFTASFMSHHRPNTSFRSNRLNCRYFFYLFFLLDRTTTATRARGLGGPPTGDGRLSQEIQRPPQVEGKFSKNESKEIVKKKP